MKLYNLEYDVKNLVIRNLSLPLDGDEEKHVNKVLNYLEIEEIDTDEDDLASCSCKESKLTEQTWICICKSGR